jgi:PAS domain S-box-containing protein
MAGRLVQRQSDGRPSIGDAAATLQQGICVVDADLRVVHCDRRFLELLDYPAELGQSGRLVTDLVKHQVERGHGGPQDDRRLVPSRLHPSPDLEIEKVSCIGAGGRRVELCTWPLPDGGFVQACTSLDAADPSPERRSAVVEPIGAPAHERADRALRSPAGDDGHLAEVADSGSAWLWESDAELRLSHLSHQFTALTGIPTEHVLGRTLLELAGESASGRHEAALRARQPLRDFCHRLTDAVSGASRHLRISGRPLIDSAGRFLGYRGTGTDITAEVEATRSAARAETRLRDAIDSLNDGFALFDEHDRLVICNRRFSEIDGLTPSLAAPGTSWTAMLQASVAAGRYATAEGRAEAYLAERLEHHRRADGTVLEQQLRDRRWIQICAYRTSDGGTVSTRTDITELKRRESAQIELGDQLRTQYLRFNAALNNMIQGLCMFDADQRLIVCNERYLQIYGFSSEVVKPGVRLREIMEYSVSLGNYRREDAERAIIERPTTADKREQAVLYQRLNDGRVIAVMHQPMAGGGSVATYEDVTQTVRAEEALRDYARRLERSNRELQDFASIASHDLQEPLRKIEAFGSRLRAKCADELSEDGHAYVERMHDAAVRMRSLINDLLTYSSVTTDARPFVAVDLGQIAQEVISDLQVTIEQADARVEVRDLPEIEADPTQMRQLLQNLLSNALKFQHEGVPPVIRISARLRHAERIHRLIGLPDLCEVTVADNGIGFEQSYAERIFGIFQRLHGRGTYPGTGIGLATCRKIVERHGGAISAISEPGQGARFLFTLPIKQPPRPDPAVERSPITVLIADDDAEDRVMIEEALDGTTLGKAVHFVEDGEQLTQYLRREGEFSHLAGQSFPSVILLDLNMPKKDGREVLRELKSDPNLLRIPIVVLTGSSAEEDVARTYDLGANSFITKPVTFEALADALRALGHYWIDIVTLPPECLRP